MDTPWGKTRIVEDKHPAKYEIKFIELGACLRCCFVPVLSLPLVSDYAHAHPPSSEQETSSNYSGQ